MTAMLPAHDKHSARVRCRNAIDTAMSSAGHGGMKMMHRCSSQ
jgi:hypothetical protein